MGVVIDDRGMSPGEARSSEEGDRETLTSPVSEGSRLSKASLL